VQLNMQKDVFLNGEKTSWDSLKAGITAKLVGTKDRAVVINIDRGVEYGAAVKLMDIVNQCDAAIVLATEVDK
jgi:biopolymer transport protein ExbD